MNLLELLKKECEEDPELAQLLREYLLYDNITEGEE